jgi:hypothetical protein
MNYRIQELVQLLHLHRRVSAGWLAGDGDLAGSRRRLSKWVTQQMKERVRLADAEQAIGEWSALAVAVRKRAISMKECDHRHVALIGQFLQST